MINSVICSFDRPAQCHLLLESIKRNADGIFNLNIIYKYSNDEYKKGYEILKERFPEPNWIEETNFREQVLKCLDSEYEYSCFMMDDDIMYINVENLENDLKEAINDSTICMSLRLGANTNKCYTMRCENVLVPSFENEKFVWWDWNKSYMDFSYVLSLDCHIFSTKLIYKMIKKVQFNNPNTLEATLNQTYQYLPQELMVAYKHSVLVNSPNNKVNTVFPNRKGEYFAYSTEDLLKKYLDGYVIGFDKLDFSNIFSPHQELSFEFKKY